MKNVRKMRQVRSGAHENALQEYVAVQARESLLPFRFSRTQRATMACGTIIYRDRTDLHVTSAYLSRESCVYKKELEILLIFDLKLT